MNCCSLQDENGLCKVTDTKCDKVACEACFSFKKAYSIGVVDFVDSITKCKNINKKTEISNVNISGCGWVD